MKEPSLVLITNHYPFAQGESFLEHEMPYLAAAFERVLIVSKNTTSGQTHQLPLNVIVERTPAETSFLRNLKTGFSCIAHGHLFIGYLQPELRYAKQKNKRGIFSSAFHFLFKAFQLSRTLEELLDKHQLSEKICFYSYWANNSALALILLKNKPASIKICRAHGGDLYEYRQKDNYLPFRETLVKELTRIYPVSLQGEHYLNDFFNHAFNLTIECSYLGTIQPIRIPVKKSERFCIVSCSGLIELKRVHLIIEGLALLHEPVLWIHFGDGILKNKLHSLAHDRLSGKNIEFEFKGFVRNTEILDFYSQTYVDLFINTSQYEGIPVSMMEAQSFGIPIVGTDVGAVNELVTPDTGRLLPTNPTPEDVARNIQSVLSLPAEGVTSLRVASRNHWETHFKAARNFSTFATKLKLLLNETSG